MQVITSEKSFYLLRFDRNEHLWDHLTTFCKKENIQAATFSAIGAAGELLLSFYHLPEKKYADHSVKEDVEILTITGNISLLQDNYIVHAHGSFGKQDLSVIGGHIKCLVVSATCEVSLQVLPGKIERAYDNNTGLNLLK